MPVRRLTRSRSKGTIAGVCAGLADYFGVDVVLMRLIFVIIALVGAIIGGVIVYVAAWIIMPEGESQPAPANGRVLRRSTTDRQLAGVCGGLAEYFQVDSTAVHSASERYDSLHGRRRANGVECDTQRAGAMPSPSCRSGLDRPPPVLWGIVWIECVLRRTQRFRHVFEVYSNAGPRVKTSAHRIDENVGRL